MNTRRLVRWTAQLSPWLAPLPSGYFVARSSYRHLLAEDWAPLALGVAIVIGLVLELLGVASVHTLLDLGRWNRQGRVARQDGWEAAPAVWAWAAATTYFVAALLLLIVLEAWPEIARFAPMIFCLVALSGGVLLAVVEQHADRKQRYGLDDTLRRQKRETKEAEPAPNLPESPTKPRPAARFASKRAHIEALLAADSELSRADICRKTGYSASYVWEVVSEWTKRTSP
jgi:hypothetical protein